MDLTVLVVWTVVSPLEYVRTVSGNDVDEGLVTVKTYGECAMTGDQSMFAFIGPLVALHGCLMIATNYLLYMVRNVEGRYQEQKYVAMASAYAFEVLVIGIPVLAAVQDSSSTRFVVLSSIVFLSDIGILCFVFIPKILFAKEGLPEGVTVGESITADAMKKAVNREVARRSISFSAYSLPPQGSSRASIEEEFDRSNSNSAGNLPPAIPEGTEEPSSSEKSLKLSKRVIQDFTRSELESIEADFSKNSSNPSASEVTSNEERKISESFPGNDNSTKGSYNSYTDDAA